MHPIAFSFGSLIIRWYGIMVALAFVAGLYTAFRRSPRAGLPGDLVLDLGPWLIVSALLGARLFYVVLFWKDEFAAKPIWELLMIQHGGLVYYGGFIGASAGFLLFAFLKHVPVWKLADVLTPSIALGCVFGRIGCFLNGCCYGCASSLPWAVRYPKGHITFPATVHPTQLYDAILNLALYGFLAWAFRRKRFDGQVFALYLVGYALQRSVVEFARGDYPIQQHYLGGWATPAHLVSFGICVAGITLLLVLPRISFVAGTASRQ